jgi:hypothetical protein
MPVDGTSSWVDTHRMMHRVALPVLGLASIASISAFAQSVISTHSGVVYFFEGSVYVGGQQMEQKFGRFPSIGEGGELRTRQGRAEVLLTPGVFLRIGGNSAIRMVSTNLSDTRVELLDGSAILEASEHAANTAVRVIHKKWQVQIPEEGVFQIDSEPPQVLGYQGEAQVTAEGTEPVAVGRGQTLPFGSVLVPEQTPAAAESEFKSWAMSRSQAISSDNATAAGIVDDPTVIENSTGAMGSLSYFPLTGIPGVAVTNPYGLSFWSPFQSALSSIYFPAYSYGSLYPGGWPTSIRQQTWHPPGTVVIRSPIGGGVHPGGTGQPRSLYNPPPRTQHPVAPHAGPHPGPRR